MKTPTGRCRAPCRPRRTAGCVSSALFPDPSARRGSYRPGRRVGRAGDLCALRYGTPDGHAPSARLAPIRTRFALPCAFAALITFVHSSDCSGRARGRAARRASGLCDTRGRPRGGPRGGRRGRRHSRGAGSAGGSRPRSRAGALAALRRSPAVARAELAETSSPDAVVSQGVALIGRRRPAARRAAPGAGVTIAVLDQAFGAAEPARRARGHGAAAARPPAPPHVRPDLRAGRARLQRQQLAPRRVRDRDRLRHGARRRPTGSSTTTRPTSSARPPTTSRTCCGRTSSSTRTRSCSGRFDGAGWFAQKVDAATAAGVLWVNSAGNYRTGTGRAPGATPTPTATSTCPATATRSASSSRRRTARPATSPGRAPRPIRAATTSSRSTTDAALTAPALDRITRAADPVERPRRAPRAARRHAAGRRSRRRARTTSSVRRVGTPPTTRLTLYCRMDLSPTARVTASSSPTPGDARGAFSVARVRRDDAAARVVLVGGPDRRRPPQARHRRAHERLHHAGRSGVGRGQRLRRHVVRGPARRRRGRAPVGRGRRRRRRRQRGAARARPARRAGARHRRVRARTCSSAPAGCASTSRRRRSARRRRRRTRSCAAPSRSRCRSTEAGTLGLVQLTVDGVAARRRRSRPAGSCSATWPTAGLPSGPHEIALTASDQSGNVATYRIDAARRQRARRGCSMRSPPRARAGAKVRICGLGARRRQRPRGPAAHQLRRRQGARADSGSRTATSAPGATSSRSAPPTARATSPRCGGVLRVRAVPGKLKQPQAGVDWRRDHRRRHDGSRSRGGPGDTTRGDGCRLLGADEAPHHAADRDHDDRLAGAGGRRLARHRARRSGPCSAWRSCRAARARSTTGTTATSTR